MNAKYNMLSNGEKMPFLILGVPLIAEAKNVTENLFKETIINAVNNNITAFDTSNSYGKSEKLLGLTLKRLKEKGLDANNVYITTKIGNSQQIIGNIEKNVDDALIKLKIDQIDAMLLHWPYPDFFVKNWEKLIAVYEKKKVKAIGIANAKVRHLEMIRKSGMIMPHILQTEIHPLNTCHDLREYCSENNITIQACTSLCSMIPLIRKNETLQRIASIHGKTLPQIVLRWHVQNRISPIFRSFNINHLQQMANIWDFELSSDEMSQISSENINYRYHPESPNCPGF